jgi:hypothetical protein
MRGLACGKQANGNQQPCCKPTNYVHLNWGIRNVIIYCGLRPEATLRT